MAIRIAINGFGRMGRLFARAIWDRAAIDLVAINEPFADAATSAHLMQFDSVHGTWAHDCVANDSKSVTFGDKSIAYSQADSPASIPWTKDQVDIVIECSGQFKTVECLQPYFAAGIPKVLVSAPVKEDGALNLVYGVNHHLYEADKHHLVTAASCTTNCLAPVVKVIQDSIGIKHGSMTTIHDITNTQVIVDAPHKDLRRARSCVQSLIPTTTGSATAITVIYPELKGRLNGHAVRVPLLNASLTDCVFELDRPVTEAAVNSLFKAAATTAIAEGGLKNILGYEERPLVSIDYLNDERSCIIDAPSTMVINDTQLKLYVWYDNEWGYVHRMADITAMMADHL